MSWATGRVLSPCPQSTPRRFRADSKPKIQGTENTFVPLPPKVCTCLLGVGTHTVIACPIEIIVAVIYVHFPENH